MSLAEYWNYLARLWVDIQNRFEHSIAPIVFKLTASPYHYWLENQRVFQEGKGNERGGERRTNEPHTGEGGVVSHSPPKLGDPGWKEPRSKEVQAEMLREAIRDDIKKYYAGEKQDWPLGFRNGLNALARQYGYKSVTAMIDAPDNDIDWEEKLIALAKEQGMYVELWE